MRSHEETAGPIGSSILSESLLQLCPGPCMASNVGSSILQDVTYAINCCTISPLWFGPAVDGVVFFGHIPIINIDGKGIVVLEVSQISFSFVNEWAELSDLYVGGETRFGERNFCGSFID